MPGPPPGAPTGAGFAFCADSSLAHFCDPLNSIEIGGVCCEPHRHNDCDHDDKDQLSTNTSTSRQLDEKQSPSFFDAYDRDGSGDIDKSEFRSGLSSVGLPDDDETVDELLASTTSTDRGRSRAMSGRTACCRYCRNWRTP